MRPKKLVVLVGESEAWAELTQMQVRVWGYAVGAHLGPLAPELALDTVRREQQTAAVVVCERAAPEWAVVLDRLPLEVGLVVLYSRREEVAAMGLKRGCSFLPVCDFVCPLAVRLRETIKVLATRKRGPKKSAIGVAADKMMPAYEGVEVRA